MKSRKRKTVKRTRYPAWYVRLRDTRDWVLAKSLLGFLALLRLLPAEAAIETTGRITRFLGMYYPRTSLARENLRKAFPEKDAAEIETILRGMWENVGRTAAEYVWLDQIFDFDDTRPEQGRFEIAGVPNFARLRDETGAAICFTAHTGNWEVLPIGAAAYGLNITALFRPPNNKYLAREVLKARRTAMGHLVPSRAGAAWSLSGILGEGGKVGMLADQFFLKGYEVEFFGRPARANPLLAKLARMHDCPVYPARTVRLPGGRFRIELAGPVEIPRDAKGKVDEWALTQEVTRVMEAWIREYPEQWLWIHNRWRKKSRMRDKYGRKVAGRRRKQA